MDITASNLLVRLLSKIGRVICAAFYISRDCVCGAATVIIAVLVSLLYPCTDSWCNTWGARIYRISGHVRAFLARASNFVMSCEPLQCALKTQGNVL